MKTNSELRELYSSLDIFKLEDDYNNSLKNESKNKAAYPFFIKTDVSYEKADTKLMIFGQHTNGWGTHTVGVTTDEVMNKYDSFLNYKYNDTCDLPFLKGMKEFMNKLKKEYRTIDYLWNNIVKMGYDKKSGFPKKFYDSIKTSFK